MILLTFLYLGLAHALTQLLSTGLGWREALTLAPSLDIFTFGPPHTPQ